MIKELVKGAASLTANVAGALLNGVADKVHVVDQVARKVGLRAQEAHPVRAATGDAPSKANAQPLKGAQAAAVTDPPLPHSVPPALVEALAHPEGDIKAKAKRGQKHGRH